MMRFMAMDYNSVMNVHKHNSLLNTTIDVFRLRQIHVMNPPSKLVQSRTKTKSLIGWNIMKEKEPFGLIN